MPVDYSKYHPKWTLIRRLVLKRAGHRCETKDCGAENAAPHPLTGSNVVLTIGHLDHDVTNNRFSNLRAMCQRCHLNYDRADNEYRKKIGKEYAGNHQLKIEID